MREGVLIFNPTAGRWKAHARVSSVVDALAASGYRVEALPTSGSGDATLIARRAARAGIGFVFALGGDGTLREAAAGVLGTEAVLGPLPAGTGNILAKALGISSDPLRAAQALAGLRPKPIRVGLCSGEPFLMQASAGLDARTMAAISPTLKRHLGPGAVTLAAVREWWRYDYREILLSAGPRALRGTFCAACNIPNYGPFILAPPAVDDRRITVVAFAGRGRRKALSFALDLARQRHLERPDVTVLQTESVTFEAPADLPLQLDGCVSTLEPPVTVSISKHRLPVLHP